ncbi:TonB-dependent receptor [Moheibacter lacus]|uniref:TonB-dependent receptor n=1 Tax=Moheibacter lacus TaxID=2745851 RepID=A0A838ZJA1_9FLAO|nr:TonB-dependent receptor [Moheibacter lacus]MBA5628434.1 TonB-dependent receptor [Moheibacter lacus]
MRFFHLLLFLLSLNFSFAQSSGIISGKITEKDGNLSLPGAVVTLSEGNRYTISNQDGSYEFLNVPQGNYTIEVDYLGYEITQQTVTVIGNENSVIDFQLSAETHILSEVVILGDRLKGQAKALNQQKNNQNITNVISSDQVGRFPDANIGDALKRVPGITMQNDQGEARNIIIRGLAPNLNSVTLNGDRIPSAEGDNRNVQMDLIPSDMISTIEVNKTLTPDMDADAIGGSVNLITRASPNGERISATLAGGYNPIRENGNYTAGFVYGNRFFDEKLGLVFSGSYNNNNFGSDNVEGVWAEYEDESNANDNFAYIEEMDIRKYDVQRIRRSVAIALDYEFNQNHKIYANGIYNWRDDRENRFRTRYRNIEPIFEGNNVVGYEGNIRRQTKGGIDNNKNKNTRLERQIVQNYAIGGEHLLGSKIDMDWSANYATASEDRPNERYIEFQGSGYTFESGLSDPKKFNLTPIGESIEQYSLKEISENNDWTEEREFGAKLNFRIPLSVITDQKGRLRFGGRLRIKDKERDNIWTEYSPVGDFGNLNQIPNVYFDGEGYQAGSQYVPGYFASPEFLGNLDLNNPNLFEGELVPAEYLSQNYKAKENIYAGYFRWDQDFTNKLSMITGVRVEHTSIDYTGNYVQDEEDLIGEINNKNDYTNILPSIAFKYSANKDLIFRAAFTTALARPNYYDLAPYVSSFVEDMELFAGNPDLDATYAYNFDLMAEKYFKSVGILSGGVFYKNLNNFIYTYRNNRYSRENFANDFQDQFNPIEGSDEWKFIQKRNGDNVDVYGFEVAIQRQFDFIPGKFWKGLGIYLNYTFTESKAKGITNEDGEERTDVNLPGTAPHMFNGSLSWENNRFSARVSLNYASDYLDELGGSEFEDRYYDEQLFLDANASFKITKNFRIFAEANNLTNQPLRYYQGIKDRTMQMEYYQPRYNFGVKFDF